MAGKSYDVFSINIKDIPFFQALHETNDGLQIDFTFTQSELFKTVRKRNTLLFEQLALLKNGKKDEYDYDVISDYLYDVVFVDLNIGKGTDKVYYEFTSDDNGNAKRHINTITTSGLQRLIYYKGFRILKVPKSISEYKKADAKSEYEFEDIYYRPFISSASMARKSEYLFVSTKWIKDLMERLSLGILTHQENHFYVSDIINSNTDLSIAKLASYIGLSLSDGQTIDELRSEYLSKYKTEKDSSKEKPSSIEQSINFILDQDSVICVDGKSDFPMPLNEISPYVWKTVPWAQEIETNLFDRIDHDELNKIDVSDFHQLVFALEEKASNEQSSALDELLNHASIDKAILQWKELLSKSFIGDSELRIEGKDIPLLFSLTSYAQDSKSYLYRWAFVYGIALLYKRLGQTGKYEDLKSRFHSSFRLDDADSLRSKEKTYVCDLDNPFAIQNSVLSFSLDELASECKSNDTQKREVLNTLLNLIKGRDKYSLAVNYILEKEDPQSVPTNKLVFSLQGNDVVRMGAVLTQPSDDDSKGELYDGVGFCDEETFDKIERLLLCEKDLDQDNHTEPKDSEDAEKAVVKDRRYDALIIRLPFIKGLLLRFNFLEFIKDKMPKDTNVSDLMIRDAFKIDRSLFDGDKPKVHIMLTKSMFKAFKEISNFDKEKIGNDPWAYYWRFVRENGFSLLITQRNTPPRSISRLNYQFLCTLGLTQGELAELAKNTIRNLKERSKYPLTFLEEVEQAKAEDAQADENMDLSASEEESEAEDGFDREENENIGDNLIDSPDGQNEVFEPLKAASAKNPKTLETRYANNLIYDATWSVLLDMMRGKLEVSGDNRFLVPDLMAVMTYITDAFVHRKDEEKTDDPIRIVSPINGVGDSVKLPSSGLGYYYAPGKNAPWAEDTGKEVCILRNPHFAVGEDALLCSLPDTKRSDYDKYFKHLTGVVFVPAAAMLTINGADSDGDIGNLCCEPVVVEACRRASKNNVDLLKKIIENQSKLIPDASSSSSVEAKSTNEYLGKVKYWLSKSIQVDKSKEVSYKEGTAPVIIYAGSGNSPQKGKSKELNVLENIKDIALGNGSKKATALEKQFWEVFQLTTEASIGLKSMEALHYAGMAYGSWDITAAGNLTLLGKWLSHYRVVTCGLDTANAIDSAKTGMRFKSISLASASDHDKKILKLADKKSHFEDYIRKYKKLAKKMASQKVKTWDDDITALMNSYYDGKPRQTEFPLDELPLIVNNLKPDNLHYFGIKDKSVQLSTVICKYGDVNKIPFPNVIKNSYFNMLNKLVEAYLDLARGRSASLHRRETLYNHYAKMLEIIVSWYPLTDALYRMRLLFGCGSEAEQHTFFERFFENGGKHSYMQRLSKTFNSDEMNGCLRTESLDEFIAKLLWSEPETRKLKLESLFGTKIENVASLNDYAEVMEMFTNKEDGIYLLKAVIKFLFDVTDSKQAKIVNESHNMYSELKKYVVENAGLVQYKTDADVSNTPIDEQNAEISFDLAARSPRDLRRQLWKATWIFLSKLYAAKNITDEEIKLALMPYLLKSLRTGHLNDFLFIELMGNDLPAYIRTNEGTE